ncbi:hypothetical protein EMCRGX_G033346 [Ephydatia muelleri]
MNPCDRILRGFECVLNDEDFKINSPKARVSMALQSAEIELGTTVKLLQSLQDFVSELRGNFDAIEMRAKQKAKYKDAEKRIRKPKTQFGDESNGLVFHQHDKFRIEVFLPILDKLSQALTLRTQAYDVVHKRFGLITEFLSMGADEIEKAAHNLQQCYPNDLELVFHKSSYTFHVLSNV